MGLKNIRQNGQQPNPYQAAQALQQNTGAMLQKMNMNVPADMQKSPDSIAEYLIKTGRITPQQWQQAQQRAAQFRGRK